jgi:site-specific recombinase XerD
MTTVAIVDPLAGPLTWLPHPIQQAWFGDKVSLATREAYLRDGWHWIMWCRDHNVDPLTATPGATRAWIDDQRQGAWYPPAVRRRTAEPDGEATIARRVSSLSRLYTVLRGEGVTTADPLANVDRPQNPQASDARILGLDVRATVRLLAAADAHSPRMAALLWLLASAGLRISEALGATLDSLALVRGHRTITVTGKGRKNRTVAVPPDAWHRLEAYLDGRTAGPLFLTEGGDERWHRADAYRAIRRLGIRSGLPGLHPHVLRHTAATLALDSGESVDIVQDMLGHASPSTTMRYRAARDRVERSASYGVARLLAAMPTTEADQP